MGTGVFSELYTHVGQWGTHVDPPAHFIKGLRTVDQIDPKEMVLPLVVIDVHDEAAKNPDYTLSPERVKKWEKDHGPIPAGAFVAMRTDWSKRWPDAAKMENKDANGIAHYPGWRLRRQATRRRIRIRDSLPVRTIIHSKHTFSEAGAIAIVTFPKPKGGSGFPARAFAIVP